MLFNSPEFLYFFLPFAITGWWGLNALQREQDAQRFVILCSIYFYGRGVAIFAKACFGPPSPSKQQKSRDRSCLRRPSRPAAFALTQQGVKASVHNDSTRCRKALHFPYAKNASGKRPALSLLGTTRLPASQRWWDTRYVPLLIGNAIGNFYLGQQIAKTRSRVLLITGLAYNIGLLGYFKYADFWLENWNLVTGSAYPMLQLVLPLGLSFFTFQVIAWLVDCYKGQVEDFSPGRFAFSISFFPHLIAGPILHYSDVMPQLRERVAFDARQFSQGLFLFAVGLFKKSVIADRIAEHVDPLFTADTVLSFFEAWVAAVGYGLQIYFDFSGYSDMAIGIGLLFGIILPQNFNSPYQAVSIADFWQRWHRTLSRFLRDYVYIPLGGNRHGFVRGLLAAALTMVIGGFWHGAAWTFVLWGLLHGLFIGLHRLWTRTGLRLAEPVAMTVTFLAVSVAWVLFRAESVAQAWSIWQGMLGLNGMAIPGLAAGLCQSCSQTSLITGIELIWGGILLTICLTYANAQQAAQQLEPNYKNLAYFSTLLFTSIWLAGWLCCISW